MEYLGFRFILQDKEDFHKDLFIDDLAGIGFDSFEDHELGFTAYIPQKNYETKLLDEVCKSYQSNCLIAINEVKIDHKNWNEEWEKNFSPIVVSNQCYIRASFHPEKAEFPYQIIIDPKMAFGTGHHQTTSSMMELMFECNFTNKSVLDMGCGTGILAILAHQLGAKKVTAIDYDDICTQSTFENAQLNGISDFNILTGGKEVIPSDEVYDIILANINRNILLDQIETYNQHLHKNGLLLLSGFYYKDDLIIIENFCNHLNLNKFTYKLKDEWTAVIFKKNNAIL